MLALPGTGQRYQMVGFDGSTSECEAVLARVTFLHRSFRGRYLVSDSEVGVIGRDVLNHLRLLLDGPGLSWGEPRSS